MKVPDRWFQFLFVETFPSLLLAKTVFESAKAEMYLISKGIKRKLLYYSYLYDRLLGAPFELDVSFDNQSMFFSCCVLRVNPF